MELDDLQALLLRNRIELHRFEVLYLIHTIEFQRGNPVVVEFDLKFKIKDVRKWTKHI